MDLDWNWFFSSLSQSAAAIVGLFGAFIISKTLTNQSAFILKSHQLENILADSENIKTQADDIDFDYYINRIREYAHHELANLSLEDPSILESAPEDLFHKLNFSLYDNKAPAVEALKGELECYREEYKKYYIDLAAAELRKAEIMERNTDKDPLSNFTFFPSLELSKLDKEWPQAPYRSPLGSTDTETRGTEAEFEKIETTRRKAIHQAKLNENFLSTVSGDPEYSGHITAILLLITLLFFAGVIYPVSFMPLAQGITPTPSLSAVAPTLFSLKGGMLTFISLIFCSIPYIFLKLNMSFKYKKHHIAKLTEYCKVASYSQHFNFYNQNIVDRAKHSSENHPQISHEHQ